MNISLKPEQEQFVQEQLAQGQYQSADEVVAKALKLLQQKQQEYEAWKEDVRAKVDEAVASLERGEGLDGETIVNQILERFQKAREAQQ